MADTGDIKFLNTCRRLLDIFTAEARWNPSNPRLAIGKLEAKLAGGYPVAADITAKLAPQQININGRQEIFAKIQPMAKGARRYLRSCGATAREIEDGNRYINELLGTVKTPAAKVSEETPAAEALRSHSIIQLSFDGRYANLEAFRDFVANVTAFKPNEEAIKLEGIESLLTDCGAANTSVSSGFALLSQALNQRDNELYKNADSVLEDFRDAKEYFKSLYNPGDPQYRTITARNLTLRDNSRR